MWLREEEKSSQSAAAILILINAHAVKSSTFHNMQVHDKRSLGSVLSRHFLLHMQSGKTSYKAFTRGKMTTQSVPVSHSVYSYCRRHIEPRTANRWGLQTGAAVTSGLEEQGARKRYSLMADMGLARITSVTHVGKACVAPVVWIVSRCPCARRTERYKMPCEMISELFRQWTNWRLRRRMKRNAHRSQPDASGLREIGQGWHARRSVSDLRLLGLAR